MPKHLLTLAALAIFSGTGFAADAPAPAKEEKKECAAGKCSAEKCAEMTISKADLEKAIADKKVTLIDCNGSESYKAGHLPGAHDFEAIKGDMAANLPKDKSALIVAYCGGVKCSAWKSGCEAVGALGYTNVKHFPEGLSGWDKAKLEK
jgi:rhodanese-related sulfurtransferase